MPADKNQFRYIMATQKDMNMNSILKNLGSSSYNKLCVENQNNLPHQLNIFKGTLKNRKSDISFNSSSRTRRSFSFKKEKEVVLYSGNDITPQDLSQESGISCETLQSWVKQEKTQSKNFTSRKSYSQEEKKLAVQRLLCRGKGITQREVADQMGIPFKTLSAWLTKKNSGRNKIYFNDKKEYENKENISKSSRSSRQLKSGNFSTEFTDDSSTDTADSSDEQCSEIVNNESTQRKCNNQSLVSTSLQNERDPYLEICKDKIIIEVDKNIDVKDPVELFDEFSNNVSHIKNYTENHSHNFISLKKDVIITEGDCTYIVL